MKKGWGKRVNKGVTPVEERKKLLLFDIDGTLLISGGAGNRHTTRNGATLPISATLSSPDQPDTCGKRRTAIGIWTARSAPASA